MIFGLGFATFLTLIMVPVMYLLSEKAKIRLKKLTGGKENGQGKLDDIKSAQQLTTN